MTSTRDRCEAEDVFEIAIGEVESLVGNFTNVIHGDTLTSVDSAEWVDADDGGMTLGTPDINDGAIDPDGRGTIATAKAVSIEVDASDATAGTYELKIIATTTNGRKKACRFVVIVRD